MKRFFCILTSVVLLLSLCSCTQTPEAQTTTAATPSTEPVISQYTAGVISGNTSENQWLGLRFVLPANMEFEDQLTHDNYNQMQMEQHPDDYTIQDLTVYSTVENAAQSPVYVALTKLTDPQQSPEVLVEAWRVKIDTAYRDLEKQYNTKVNAQWSEPYAQLFLGHPYIVQHHTTENTEFWDMFRVQDGHMVNIHFAQIMGGSMGLEDFLVLFTGCSGASDSTKPTGTPDNDASAGSVTEPTGIPLISCLDYGKQLLEMTKKYNWDQ